MPSDSVSASTLTTVSNLVPAVAVQAQAGKSELSAGSVPQLTYDFRLFQQRPGEEPNVTAQVNNSSFPATPPDPQKEARKRRIADALIAFNPQFQVRQFSYDQIAQFERLSVDAAKSKYRHLELNGPEGGNGIQIVLRDEDASVTVPFWHEGQKAADAFQELCRFLEIICREAGFCAYDSQLRGIVDPSNGKEQLAHYNAIVRHLREKSPVEGRMEGAQWIPVRIAQLVRPQGRGVVLVAVQGTGISCGFAELSISYETARAAPPVLVAHLNGWFVLPEFRARGVGRRLLEAAESWAAFHGLRELACAVKVENKAGVQTLLSFGFVQANSAPHFIKSISVLASGSEAA